MVEDLREADGDNLSAMIISTPNTLTQGVVFNSDPLVDPSAGLTISETAPNTTLKECTINGRGTQWGLKLPHNTGGTFEQCSFNGGLERALDIVRGGNHEFAYCVFGEQVRGEKQRDPQMLRLNRIGRKQCDVGIKGGALNITFRNCIMRDILLGDFSIYDHTDTLPKVDEIRLINCYHPVNGKRIIVRCLNAFRPIVVGTKVDVLKVPDPLVAIYFEWCRRFGDTRNPYAK